MNNANNTKLTLEELNDRIGEHDGMAMARTEAGRVAYVAIVDAILADAGWTVDEYETALADRIFANRVG